MNPALALLEFGSIATGIQAGDAMIKRGPAGEALGVIETHTVAATIEAADAAVKGATVDLVEVHLADGLGGKGYALFSGTVSDVEAAVAIGVGRLGPGMLVASVVIPRLHDEMGDNIFE